VNTRNPQVQRAVDLIAWLHMKLLRTRGRENGSLLQRVLIEAVAASTATLDAAGVDLTFTDSGVSWARRERAEAKP
jgi:hypothetical protein